MCCSESGNMYVHYGRWDHGPGSYMSHMYRAALTAGLTNEIRIYEPRKPSSSMTNDTQGFDDVPEAPVVRTAESRGGK